MMKKILHILPMLAVLGFLVLQSSCWNNGYDPDYSFVISMNATQASSSTKGVINEIDDLKDKSFGVYGYKVTPAKASIMVFADQQVTWNPANRPDAWGYSPLKYWDRDAKYYYAAYAPFGIGKISHTDTNQDVAHILTFTEIPNWQFISTTESTRETKDASLVISHTDEDSTSVKDFMTAVSSGEARTYLTEKDGQVEFSFSHRLFALRINVGFPDRPTGYHTDYRITSIEISSDAVSTEVPASGKNSEYKMNFSSIAETSGLAAGKEKFDVKEEDFGIATVYPQQVGESLIVPTNFVLTSSTLGVPFSTENGINVTIKYIPKDWDADGAESPEESTTFQIPLGTFPETYLNSFDAGKLYTLNIKFDKGKKVDLVGVAINWLDEVTLPDHPVFNW